MIHLTHRTEQNSIEKIEGASVVISFTQLFFLTVSSIVSDTKRTISCYQNNEIKGKSYGPELNKPEE